MKPGGQILFFEANYWNPQVAAKNFIRPLGRWAGMAECALGLRKYVLMKVASHQGFVDIDIIPYDIGASPNSAVPVESFEVSGIFAGTHSRNQGFVRNALHLGKETW